MCPFCFHLGYLTCCRIAGCWDRVSERPAEESEQAAMERKILVVLGPSFRAGEPRDPEVG
jgi:hypothetical protein